MNKHSEAAIHLTMYSRLGCHLCDEMVEGLALCDTERDFELTTIDIDTDIELVSRFGTKVPVLMHGNHEICHYFLDLKALQLYFQSLE